MMSNIPTAHFVRSMPKRLKLKKPIIPPKPTGLEREYEKELVKIVKLIKLALNEFLIPKLSEWVSDVNKFNKKVLRDDASSDVDKTFEKIKLFLNSNVNAKQIATDQFGKVNRFNSFWFKEQLTHTFGINIFTNDTWLADHLATFVSTNVNLIQSLQDTALSQVKHQVHQGFALGLRPSRIALDISERLDVAESRAKLIARDQTSKLNGQLNELKQTDLGVSQYTWSTSKDERVRETHAEKENKVFDWDSPPLDTGHPGEDYQCRCVALPVFKGTDFDPDTDE